MKYRRSSIKALSVQFYEKVIRKINSFLKNKRKNIQTDFYVLNDSHTILNEYSRNPSYNIIVSDKPPYGTFTFFPLGKIPDMTESFCFIAYSGREIAGWSWLHKGLRIDTKVAHYIKNDENFLWFGPDFVMPEHRGKSLQKALIHARLLFAQNKFSKEIKCVTIIDGDNYPSINSYVFFGFEPSDVKGYI